MTVSRVPQWIPSHSLEVRTVAAGCWWDAVRVSLPLADEAMRRLGDESGAVIADEFGSRLYWLVRPGSADGWHLPRVSVLGPGYHVAVPPLHRTASPGLHWRVAPSLSCEWTCASRLRSALDTALSSAGHR